MIGLSLLVAVAVAGTMPAAAPAQASELKTAERVMRSYAQCVVAGDRAGARAVLLSVPLSAEEIAATERLLDGRNGCMRVRGKLRMQRVAMRTAIAEELYRTEFKGAPAAPAEAAAPFVGSGNAALARYDVTRCVAMRAPVVADRYVRTSTDAEAKAAMSDLMPALQACLPSGARLGFDRITMRGLLAEGLFHIRQGRMAGASGIAG